MHTAGVDSDGVLAVLERDGLLLVADSLLPSVVSLVAGERVRGSWWGHRLGGEIFRVVNAAADGPDVLTVKLISGKVTLVHRRLWPAIAAIGRAREAWQMDELAAESLVLLEMVDEDGRLDWDAVPPFLPPNGSPAVGAVRQLEARLLVHTSEVHTPRGAHARNLQTWGAWADSAGIGLPPSAAGGRQQLETVLEQLNKQHGARARLPWQPRHAAGAR
jgi:hypothetical protein